VEDVRDRDDSSSIMSYLRMCSMVEDRALCEETALSVDGRCGLPVCAFWELVEVFKVFKKIPVLAFSLSCFGLEKVIWNQNDIS
jgi:hypothetical protein